MKHIKLFEELNWFKKKPEAPKPDHTESDKNVRAAFESIKATFKADKLSFQGNQDTDDEDWLNQFTYKITETYHFVLTRTNDFQLFNFRNPNKIDYTIKIGTKLVECSEELCDEIFNFFKSKYKGEPVDDDDWEDE